MERRTPDSGPKRPSTSIEEAGTRLARQAGWLALLFAHLAGPRVRSQVEREDLVQEVFLRALASGSDLPDDEPALRRYLATVARRVVIDVLRALRARKRDALVLPLDTSRWSEAGPAASWTGPLSRLARTERHDALVATFERLSPEHRRVLGLRQLEGWSARVRRRCVRGARSRRAGARARGRRRRPRALHRRRRRRDRDGRGRVRRGGRRRAGGRTGRARWRRGGTGADLPDRTGRGSGALVRAPRADRPRPAPTRRKDRWRSGRRLSCLFEDRDRSRSKGVPRADRSRPRPPRPRSRR